MTTNSKHQQKDRSAREAGPTTAGRAGAEVDFYTRVHNVVRRIPLGRVTTYGAIAAFLGLKSAARTVGYALMAVPEELALPCHRVVNRNGELSGKHHFATPNLMRDLLESEGVRFEGDAVAIAEHFWDPAYPRRKPAAAQQHGAAKRKGKA